MRLLNIIIALLLTSLLSFGQTYEMNNVSGQTINTCSGTFYDSGGSGGDYNDNETYSVTFCSDQAGSQISLDFTQFDTESCCDHIDIYDGTGTTGTQLVASAGGSALLGQIIESQGSGCLTIVFDSDGSITHAGWEAAISCTFPCQDFTADIVNTSEPYYNGDTIRLCQNTPLTFTAAGTYPNNGTNYTQSDATSTFHWDFGDGTDTSGVGLTTVSHSFPEGGYYVVLDVYDQNNCDNSNLIMNTVMVSTTPLFTGTNITDTICPGETVNFTGQANTHSWSQPLPAIIGDTTFLPDGNGVSYETSLTYNIFQSGATLTDITDLESVCLNIEHSYAGDLDITLICPNGSQAHLVVYNSSNNLGWDHVGEPIDDFDSDNGSSPEGPGTGYDYCWTTIPVGQTWDDAADGSNTYSYTDVNGATYTDISYIPAGNYDPMGNDWNNLLGCPLNGDWSIQVTDNLNSDDGYIFEWTINWDTSLTTSLWVFGNTYDNTQYTWAGQNINSQTNGIGTAVPTTSGTTELYTFTAIDDFGCAYDTILPVYIYPTNSPGCCVTPIPEAGNNDSICGLSIQLNATMFDSGNSGLWTVTGPGNVTFDNAMSPTATATANTYGEYIFTWTEINPAGCQASDMVSIWFNKNPLIQITAPALNCFGDVSDITVIFDDTTDAPFTYLWNTGETTNPIINKSTGNYTVTVTNIHGCTSTLSTSLQEPPLLETQLTKTDLLCNGDNTGSIHCEITGGTPQYNIQWLPSGSGTDLTNIPAGQYNIKVTDANGCIKNDSITVNEPTPMVSSYTTTSLGCAGSNNGNINLTVSGGTPNYSFLWNNGATTQNLQDIGGDVYSVTITDMNQCIVTHNNIEITEPDPIIASITPESTICLTNSQDLMCSALGGTPPYTYLWNTGESTYNITVTPNDTTTYNVIVTDANGCNSPLTETTVNVRPPISATAIGDNIEICPGDPLNITVTPQGGNGHYIYTLQDGQNVTQDFTIYPSETTTYIITVSDDCGSPTGTAQVDVSVLDAPPLSFSADITQGCQPLVVTFTEQSDDEGQTYEWDFGDNSPSNIGSAKQPIHIYENSGLFDVSLQVTSVEGCKTTQHIFNLIDVYKNPIAKFYTNHSDASVIKPEIIFNNNSIDGYNYYWDFGDGSTYIGTETIHTYPNISNNYTVTLVAESNKGCRDTTHSTVYIYDVTTFYAPTAFSPDGDGINDVWKVVGSGIDMDNVTLRVYDRWGEVIFESNDITSGWDGTIKNNKPAPVGIYYWVIVYNDLQGIQFEKAGSISLIK